MCFEDVGKMNKTVNRTHKASKFLMITLLTLCTFLGLLPMFETKAVAEYELYDEAKIEKVIDTAKSYLGSYRWNGYCGSFVYNCFNEAGIGISSHNGKNYIYYNEVHEDKNPPRGAIVCWRWKNNNSEGKNYGHVAIMEN